MKPSADKASCLHCETVESSSRMVIFHCASYSPLLILLLCALAVVVNFLQNSCLCMRAHEGVCIAEAQARFHCTRPHTHPRTTSHALCTTHAHQHANDSLTHKHVNTCPRACMYTRCSINVACMHAAHALTRTPTHPQTTAHALCNTHAHQHAHDSHTRKPSNTCQYMTCTPYAACMHAAYAIMILHTSTHTHAHQHLKYCRMRLAAMPSRH